jgi:hypothetical protein
MTKYSKTTTFATTLSGYFVNFQERDGVLQGMEIKPKLFTAAQPAFWFSTGEMRDLMTHMAHFLEGDKR